MEWLTYIPFIECSFYFIECIECWCHNFVFFFRQQALLAAISEKDANIALLELSASNKKKTQEEVLSLKRERDKLMHQLKQHVSTAAQCQGNSICTVAGCQGNVNQNEKYSCTRQLAIFSISSTGSGTHAWRLILFARLLLALFPMQRLILQYESEPFLCLFVQVKSQVIPHRSKSSYKLSLAYCKSIAETLLWPWTWHVISTLIFSYQSCVHLHSWGQIHSMHRPNNVIFKVCLPGQNLSLKCFCFQASSHVRSSRSQVSSK